MDKWKDIELEKMKAGGNGKFRLFLELQDDYNPNWTLQEKYNSKAAALFRDKVRITAFKQQEYTFKCFVPVVGNAFKLQLANQYKGASR